MSIEERRMSIFRDPRAQTSLRSGWWRWWRGRTSLTFAAFGVSRV